MRLRFLIILAAVAAVLVGCGGGGGSDRLSADEFRQQANAVCDKYDAKITALAPSSGADVASSVEKVIPLIEQGLAELRALNPPEELADDYDRMLDETAKAIPAARKLADAAANQDTAAMQEALQEGRRASDESDRIATELGLTQCVSD